MIKTTRTASCTTIIILLLCPTYTSQNISMVEAKKAQVFSDMASTVNEHNQIGVG
jgi:hypothetical protein